MSKKKFRIGRDIIVVSKFKGEFDIEADSPEKAKELLFNSIKNEEYKEYENSSVLISSYPLIKYAPEIVSAEGPL